MNSVFCVITFVGILASGFAVEEKKPNQEFQIIPGYINLPLKGFEYSLLTFINNLSPSQSKAVYGIRSALPNKNSSCYDKFASWPQIIEQLPPLYNAWEEQLDLLIKNLLRGAVTPLTNPIIRMTAVDLVAVISGFQLAANGDKTEITSLQNLEKVIYGILYNIFTRISDDRLEVSQRAADELVSADLATTGGNKILQEALDNIVNVLSSPALAAVQNNNQTLAFVGILKNTLSDLAAYCGDLVSTINYGANLILENASIQVETIGISCSKISEIVISGSTRLADILEQMLNTLATAKENVLRYS